MALAVALAANIIILRPDQVPGWFGNPRYQAAVRDKTTGMVFGGNFATEFECIKAAEYFRGDNRYMAKCYDRRATPGIYIREVGSW